MKTPSASVTDFCLRNPGNSIYVTDRQTGALWGGSEAMKADCARLGLTFKRGTDGWKIVREAEFKQPTKDEDL